MPHVVIVQIKYRWKFWNCDPDQSYAVKVESILKWKKIFKTFLSVWNVQQETVCWWLSKKVQKIFLLSVDLFAAKPTWPSPPVEDWQTTPSSFLLLLPSATNTLPTENVETWEIEYRPAIGGEWQRRNVSGNASQVQLTGLTSSTNYIIRLRGIGKSEKSDWSNTAAVLIPEDGQLGTFPAFFR